MVMVVDDDPSLRELVSLALTRAGYTATTAADGFAAWERLQVETPAALVLDVLMPEMDGTELCRRLRASPEGRLARLPVLMLSSRDDDIDRVVGLEMGADDYLGKPFSPRELVARVKALLRRAAPVGPPPVAAPVAALPPTLLDDAAILRHGPLALDPERFRARWQAHELDLTPTEFGLLRTLMERPGRVCTREHLIDRAYVLHRLVSDRTIDSHIRRLRAKLATGAAGALGPDAGITTLHGVGYRLAEAMD